MNVCYYWLLLQQSKIVTYFLYNDANYFSLKVCTYLFLYYHVLASLFNMLVYLPLCLPLHLHCP